MPAKGWRKDEQESNFDTALHNENVGIDAFLFPKSTITKLSKQVLVGDDGTPTYSLAADSSTAVQRASVLFLNLVYHHAKQIVKQQGRKVVNADDVIAALNSIGFNHFVPTLEDELNKFTERKAAKKLAKAQRGTGADADAEADADVDVDADADADADADVEGENSSSKRIKLDPSMEPEDEAAEEADEADETNASDDDAEEDDVMVDAIEEDEDDDDELVDSTPIHHQPSQLELEQRELEGEQIEQVDPADHQNDSDENL